MSRRVEIGTVYLAGLAQGLALVTFPAASNVFTSAEFHNLTSSEYGSLFIPMVSCAILGSSFGGPLAHVWGLRRVFLIGLAFNLASMSVLAVSQWVLTRHDLTYALLLLAMACLGVGFGTTLTGINTYAPRFFPQKQEAALTALHALLGTGTALAPLLAALFVGLAAWWLLPVSVGTILVILLFIGVRQSLDVSSAGGEAVEGSASDLLQNLPGRLWLYAAIAILYGICETVFANWATIYLHEDKGLSMDRASFGLAMFWAMVTVGRIIVTGFTVWVSGRWIYFALPFLILAAFVGIPQISGSWENVGAFGFAGLACSAFLPLSISFATQEFPNLAEFISGGMMAAYLVGFGIGSYGVGPLREAGDIALSLIYTGSTLLAAGMAVLAFILIKFGKENALE